MLARPEFNTREDILLWLGGRPRDSVYYWGSPYQCACAQYAQARGKAAASGAEWYHHGGNIRKLNDLAYNAASGPHGMGTFGALYDLVEKKL